MESTSVETAANVLLREQAARQALVDRLQANSFWPTFVGRIVLPVGILVLILTISAMSSGEPTAALALTAGVVGGMFSLSIALAQVSRQLHALTAVLESTGVLAAFISSPARNGVLGSANRMQAPPGPGLRG